MLDPLEGLRVTPIPTLVRSPQFSEGLGRQEIWLETVRLLRKEDPGGYRLRTKATSSLSTAPSSEPQAGEVPELPELVVVNGQLVKPPRACLSKTSQLGRFKLKMVMT